MKVILILGVILTLATAAAGQGADAADTSANAADTASGAPTLSITTDPPDAAVRIGGIDYGATPIKITGLTPGEHSVELSKPGHFRRRVTIVLDSAGADLSFELTRPVSIAIASDPEGAEVVINGETAGKSPIKKESLRPGEYKVSVTMEGYESVDTTLTLSSGDNASARLVLTQKAEPAATDVVIDTTEDKATTAQKESASDKKKKTWVTEAVLITFFVFIAVIAGVELSSY